MFKAFLKKHSFSEYDFSTVCYPDISNREYWDNYASKNLVAEAEKYLSYGWPPIKATLFMEFKKSGNRVCMEDVHFERREAFMRLVMGELKENKGRFLGQIVDGMFSLCEESYWGLSAHYYKKLTNIPSPYDPFIDLFAAETAEHLAVACTLLRSSLLEFCPEIIERVERELEIRIKEPYFSHTDFHWMGYEIKPANWNPWILSNILTVFLLTEKDRSRLELGLSKMFVEIQHYYDAIPSDGGCDEGVHYWDRAGAALFEFVYQLKLASGGALDLFGDEKLGKMGLYTKNAHISGARFICFADCSQTKKTALIPFIYGYGRETNKPELMSLAKEVFRDGEIDAYAPCVTMRRNILCHDLIEEMLSRKDISDYEGEKCAVMQELQVATVREGEWVVAAKGGNNAESHNHNDIGSFCLYHGGEAVLCDVGTGVYSRKNFSPQRYEIPWVRSLTHNLPEINGIEERNGKEYAADSFSAGEGFVKISFASAYPTEAGISSLVRRCELKEKGLTVTDEFVFSGEGKKITEAFVTTLPVRIDSDSVIIGEKYRVKASLGAPKTEFYSFEGDTNLVGSWKCEGLTRITFTAENVKAFTVSVEKIKA